jgi:hypothetical protein
MHEESPGSDIPTNVNIEVKKSDGIHLDSQNTSVISHPNQRIHNEIIPYFSPNNMHLSGLHSGPLTANEMYSFVSELRWNGQAVDTLHIISGDIQYLLDIADQSKTFDEFVKKLNPHYRIYHTEFEKHFDRMVAFANE